MNFGDGPNGDRPSKGVSKEVSPTGPSPLLLNPLLLAHLRLNRIAHTYLFTGPEGEKKNKLVLGFAQALNCERGGFLEECPTGAITILEKKHDGGDCGCVSCKKIEKGIHPDLRWLGKDEKVRSLKIEEVRSVLHEASLKPFEGKWKVFVFQGAERLTLEAANALLKTLEEPPGHSVFLLLVEAKAHLLETIQSRGFEIRVPPEPEPDPREAGEIRLLEEKGWEGFFEGIRASSRTELAGVLENLLRYFKTRSAEEWPKSPTRSENFLKAFDSVYEVQEAVDANVNQKLALTHLEIQLRRHCEEP